MRSLAVITTFLLSFSLLAGETVKTTISQIYEPTANDPDYLVLANNGYVYGIEAQDEYLARVAREALASGQAVEIEIEDTAAIDARDERGTISNITVISGSVEIPLRDDVDEIIDYFDSPEHHLKPMDGYTMTSLSWNSTTSLFRSMRNDLSGASQCYNRAHVWSWEIYQKNRYNTGKMFLFFTRKYINEYRYKWWFHVAPFINTTGETQHMVLDRQYTRGPLRMHSWTDIFMRNDAHCPVIDKYSSYSQNQYSRYCYLIPASMYYWQPYNLDRLERNHTRKSYFVQSQIDHAYRDARRGLAPETSDTTVEND